MGCCCVPRESDHGAAAMSITSYPVRVSHVASAIEMVAIPGGSFIMGSETGAPGHQADESPPHRVQVDPFWMSAHEVTWDVYLEYMSECYTATGAKNPVPPGADAVLGPSDPVNKGQWQIDVSVKGRKPVSGVTHLAARQFTKWLSKKTGQFYRLPTEVEWEYAARAQSQAAYCFGDDVSSLRKYGWYLDSFDKDVEPHMQRVGLLKPNAWGLYDMHGNVAEWVMDQYGSYGDHRRAVVWPRGRYGQVARGGGCDGFSDELRCAVRVRSTPEWQEMDPQVPPSLWWLATDRAVGGFRIVRPLRAPSETGKQRWWGPDDELKEIVEKMEYKGTVIEPATIGNHKE